MAIRLAFGLGLLLGIAWPGLPLWLLGLVLVVTAIFPNLSRLRRFRVKLRRWPEADIGQLWRMSR